MELVGPSDPILLGKAASVTFPSPTLPRLSAQMLCTMIQHHGCGLAAPQVGVGLRIFTYGIGKEFGVMVNPSILERGDEIIDSKEGCLSLPDEFWTVKRHKEILIRYQDIAGKTQTRQLGNGDEINRVLSIIAQHEIQHLDGILISQHGQKE